MGGSQQVAGLLAAFLVTLFLTAARSPEVLADAKGEFAAMDQTFDEYRLDAHIPGLVYGIVKDGRLIHVAGFGVQDIATHRPVTSETLFRIASMTKAFTALSILKLRDDGQLSLDERAEEYVPEMRDWHYPTEDSPRIRVRDLLTHTAGFVTDDPWGDRQTPLPDAEFSRLLSEGIAFSSPPGTRMEYSNLGFALLGRIVSNVSRMPYREYVEKSLLGPLGMTSSGFEFSEWPAERRALGYRWEDAAWRREDELAHGAFGAMGGLQTSADDYAKYVAWLLSAWPSRDGADAGPVKRASVRELAQGSNFPQVRKRPTGSGESCAVAVTYGMGWWVGADCELGQTLSHSGGYPGYGSHILLLPEYGIGVFALANRTYAVPSVPVWNAAVMLKGRGTLKARPGKASELLKAAYDAVTKIVASGSVTSAGDVLAMNFLMDRSAENWARELQELEAEVGDCTMREEDLMPTGTLSGEFTWHCEHGRVKGSVLLAPTPSAQIQGLRLARATP